MKKRILLFLSALLLAGCSVKDQETEITVFQNTVTSVYTGKVKQKVPNGEGTAILDTDASVSGTFENGIFLSGEASGVPYRVSYRDQKISGSYTGAVSEQLPSGNGEFTSDTYSYKGTWINGAPDGEGTLTASIFCIDTPSGILEGSYSGDVRNGLAEGNGTFTYQSDTDEIQLSGNFTNNRFDGLLTKTIHYPNTEKSYPVYYQNGSLLQSSAAMIAYLEGMRNESYCLSEAQLSFLSDHSALFEGTESQNLPEAGAFDYEAFKETDTPSLILISNAVVRSVQRYKPYADSDTVTSMIVQNNEGWYHLVFAYAVESADTGDSVNIYALPLCRSTLTAPEQDYAAIDAAGAVVIGG